MWFAEIRPIIKVLGFFLSIVLLHSIIDYWYHPVVRPSATLCIVAFRRFRVGVQDQKLYTSVSIAANFLFVRSDTFAVWSFSYKKHVKNESKKTRTWVVLTFETQKTTRRLVLKFSTVLTVENLRRSTSRTLLVTLWWIEFGCFHKILPAESDCASIGLFEK